MLPTERSLVCVYADNAMVFAWMLIAKGSNLKNLPPGYLGWWNPKLCDMCSVALSVEGLLYMFPVNITQHNCFVLFSKVVNDTSKCLGSVKTYNYNILYQGQT